MADKKISQLPAATLPLAGTELLPIVQSGTTDNITVSNLAVGNIKSNATTGVLQVTGPAAASTRVMTTPDANFTAARTDAGQTFTGNQTFSGNVGIGAAPVAWSAYKALDVATQGAIASTGTQMTMFQNAYWNGSAMTYKTSNAAAQYNQVNGQHQFSVAPIGTAGNPISFALAMGIDNSSNVTVSTGNLVIGTSGKGIDFSATASGSGTMTSELLADYEEGTWTPTDASGAGLSLTINNARYTKIGNRVYISAYVTYPATANTNPIFISGLPYTSGSNYRQMYVGTSSVTVINGFQISGSSTTGALTLTDGNLATNNQMSEKYLMINGNYDV